MTQSIPPADLPEDEAGKMKRLTEAVMSGLYDAARTYYIDMLRGIWAFGARRDQLLSDIRPVTEIEFSETALDSLLNDGTFVEIAFDAPHPYNAGHVEKRQLIFHRDNIEKVDVHQNPEKYRERWREFRTTQRLPYVEAGAEVDPSMSSPNYPWNQSEEVQLVSADS
jgi:hypothetical protein